MTDEETRTILEILRKSMVHMENAIQRLGDSVAIACHLDRDAFYTSRAEMFRAKTALITAMATIKEWG